MAPAARDPHHDCVTTNSMSRALRVWAGVAVIGLATVIGWAGGGAAVAGRGHGGDRQYVALGDSVAFGYSPLLEDPWLPERFVGYPEIVDQRTALRTTNLACPGQTAQALISRTAVDNGCFDG